MVDDDNHHSQVAFPMTQLSPAKDSLPPQAKTNSHAQTNECAAAKKLLKEAELAKRVLLFLIEKYNLPPAVIAHALFVNSGDVDATVEYLENPSFSGQWTSREDWEVLQQGDMDEIIQRHGIDALQERREFLRQVCEEAVGSLSVIEAKLK